ncbi:MAG: glycosyltransferase [Clostridiales bacterium]|nr:glycosyltransferase [Clostridiales bacterium]
MKVLVVCGSFPPIKCGVGDYANVLYNKMADKIDVTVLTSKNADVPTDSKVKIINSIEKWKGYSLYKAILKEIKRGKYDLVHFQFPTSEYVNSSIMLFIVLPIILKLRGIKVVYTIHEYSNNRWISKVLRKPAIYCSNRIIVVEDAFKSDILKRNKLINKNKINIIHIGANVPKSTKTKDEILCLRNKILTDRRVGIEKIVGYFGFINVSKRLDIILQAFAELKNENKLKSLLLIIGEFNSEKCPQELFDELQNIIKNNELEDYIYITGYVEDLEVGDYLKASDATVFLFKNGVSVRNGSMLAAQQEGRTIITTRPTNNLEYFDNGQFRLVENDVETVKAEILRAQDNPTENFIQNDNDPWDAIVHKHIEIYEELVKK